MKRAFVAAALLAAFLLAHASDPKVVRIRQRMVDLVVRVAGSNNVFAQRGQVERAVSGLRQYKLDR